MYKHRIRKLKNDLWYANLKIDQLEKDKQELIDILIAEYKEHDCESWYINDRVKNGIEKYTGRSIEELLK